MTAPVSVSHAVPFHAFRDSPDARDRVKQTLSRQLAVALDEAGLIDWLEKKDPVREQITVTATLKPPPAAMPVSAMQAMLQDEMRRQAEDQKRAIARAALPDWALDPDAFRSAYPGRPFPGDPLSPPKYTRAQMAEAIDAATAKAKEDAKAPSQMLLQTERQHGEKAGREAVIAKVAAALDAVEADLLPGTDPAFVVVLLRDRLKELEEGK